MRQAALHLRDANIAAAKAAADPAVEMLCGVNLLRGQKELIVEALEEIIDLILGHLFDDETIGMDAVSQHIRTLLDGMDDAPDALKISNRSLFSLKVSS